MTLVAELAGAFVAGGFASIVAVTWIARVKLRKMLRPTLPR